jgi:hypothetical protein
MSLACAADCIHRTLADIVRLGKIQARCDCALVETDLSFPTDIGLLYDALRKAIGCSAELGASESILCCGFLQYVPSLGVGQRGQSRPDGETGETRGACGNCRRPAWI